MPTITLKNIPEELYERIRRRAKEHRRSINSEVIVNLERGFLKRVRTPEEILADVDVLREKTRDMPPLTDEEIRQARDGGRP
jgi:plasmid stability protein